MDEPRRAAQTRLLAISVGLDVETELLGMFGAPAPASILYDADALDPHHAVSGLVRKRLGRVLNETQVLTNSALNDGEYDLLRERKLLGARVEDNVTAAAGALHIVLSHSAADLAARVAAAEFLGVRSGGEGALSYSAPAEEVVTLRATLDSVPDPGLALLAARLSSVSPLLARVAPSAASQSVDGSAYVADLATALADAVTISFKLLHHALIMFAASCGFENLESSRAWAIVNVTRRLEEQGEMGGVVAVKIGPVQAEDTGTA
ncbi:hypothetical protein ABLE68_07540 [Nocardioides sp. CN2-186]|uniref:hypothetical protein n=1 Tax=Nocardioides tweenelious TaxID=3156607 RepID=UPI0032B39F95